jgi:hypothetical protein
MMFSRTCLHTESLWSANPPYKLPILKSFGDRKNIPHSWVGEHRIVSTPAGDMAYEYGTVHMAYDSTEEGGHHEFEAVILSVYRTVNGVCQKVALTMQPLEEESKH